MSHQMFGASKILKVGSIYFNKQTSPKQGFPSETILCCLTEITAMIDLAWP